MILALLLAALLDPAAPPSARAVQRLELRRDVAKTNGVWKLHEWGHYFVVTDVADAAFLEELERQVFRARESCSRLFPEAGADPVRDDRRLPVLRVAKSAEEYQSYGGPGGSNGYWSAVSGEIVVHDDAVRRETWIALAGCVALEFVDEVFGIAPRADWFELGISEYCLSSLRPCKPTEADLAAWPTLEALLARAPHDWARHLNDVPSPRLVAGSLACFLLDEEQRGPGFDPRWGSIPERYAVGWIAHGDEAKARAFAFEGVDLAALERAWLQSLRP